MLEYIRFIVFDFIPLLRAPTIITALAVAHCYPLLSKQRQRWATIVLIVLATLQIGLLVVHARAVIKTLPMWDFLSFYVDGSVAARGENFYDPQYGRAVAQGFNYDDEFARETLDIGFKYPPPTMFLFAWLGFFEPHVAAFLWSSVQFLFFALCTVLLRNVFFRDLSPSTGLLVSVAIFSSVPAVAMTVAVSQTNFLLLFLLLQFWTYRSTYAGGVYAATAVVVKPFLVVGGIYLLARRKWGLLLAATLTGMTLLFASWVVFGTETLVSYLTPGRLSKLPAFMYTQEINQSLLAALYRFTGQAVDPAAPLDFSLYVLLAAALALATAWLVYRARPNLDDYAIALTVLLGLLVFPHSLAHYSTLLIIPALLLWRDRRHLGLHPVSAIALIVAGLMLADYSTSFIAYGLYWIAISTVLLRVPRQKCPVGHDGGQIDV